MPDGCQEQKEERKIESITEDEELAIELLKKAQRHWPESIWIFVAGGQLYIMKKDNGKHAIRQTGGVDPAFVLDTVAIEADGGDW